MGHAAARLVQTAEQQASGHCNKECLAVWLSAVGHLGQQAAWPLKSKAAMLLAAVTRQQGPETYSALLPQLVSSAAEGPMQVRVAVFWLRTVSVTHCRCCHMSQQ